ncbi:MAG TPA: hypothetical protein VJI46_07270 [Candidatus Nanoarchaeia archaeon]|nr:hypothetical protein [Candidatus Nanoarchaeia archaeon]
MALMDDDLEHAKMLKEHSKIKKDRDFSKMINKKALGSYEMDELFVEGSGSGNLEDEE